MGPSAPNGSGPLRLRLEPCGEGEQAFGAVDDGIVDHLAVHRDRGAALRLGNLETLHDPLRRRDLVRRRAEAVVEHRDDLGMDAGRAGEAETARVAHHGAVRSEEHTSELQSPMRISYAVFCLKKKTGVDSTRASVP